MSEYEDKYKYKYESCDFNIESYLAQVGVNSTIDKQGILVLPNDNWRNAGKPAYMPETFKFVKWVKQQDEIENAINVVELQEMGVADLRSYDIWLPLIYLCSDTSFQIFLNIVASYLYDRLRGSLKNEKPMVHLEILSEDKSAKKTKRFTYEGNLEGLRNIIEMVDVNDFMD